MIAAVVGGGLKLLGAEFPLLSSARRQALLGAAGIVLVAFGLQTPSPFDLERSSSREHVARTINSELEQVATEINRIRSGQTPPDGFLVNNEIVPLTDIFTQLETADLHDDARTLLLRKAELALQLAQGDDAGPS